MPAPAAAPAKTLEARQAVAFLARVWAAAEASNYAHRTRAWIDPDDDPKVRDAILGLAYPTSATQAGPYERREAYRRAVMALMPEVQAASLAWAAASLERQSIRLGSLRMVADLQADRLHTAAVAAKLEAATLFTSTSSTQMTADEMREVIGEGKGSRRGGGTAMERFRRVSYMRAVRKGGDKDLLKLMAHPRGVEIVDAYARSAEAGRELATEILEGCIEALREVGLDLADDADLVWRFPPAIAAGVATMGYSQWPGFTGFALGWATVQSRTSLEKALDVAGNAVMALELVGGPVGAAVMEVLDFVLASIGAAVAMVRQMEQDQAAEATAFADKEERLSEGGSKVGTVLAAAGAILTAVALPATVSRIAKRAGKPAGNLTGGAEALARAPDASDARGLSHRGLEAPAVKAPDRGLAAKGTADTSVPSRWGAVETPPPAATKAATDPPVPMASKSTDLPETAPAAKSTQGPHGGALPPAPVVPSRPVLKSNTVALSGDTAHRGLIKEIRAERKADGALEFRITGELGDPLPRPHPDTPDFNRQSPPGSMIGLPDYEVAHMWGPGFGDEARDGLMYAPREMNQAFQNRGIEDKLRQLHEAAKQQGATIHVTVTANSYPLRTWRGHEILKDVKYEFHVVLPDKTRLPLGRVDIGVPPPGSTGDYTLDIIGGFGGVWSL